MLWIYICGGKISLFLFQQSVLSSIKTKASAAWPNIMPTVGDDGQYAVYN